MDDHRDGLADCAQSLDVQHDLKDLAVPFANLTYIPHDVVMAKSPAAVLTALDFDFAAGIEKHKPSGYSVIVDLDCRHQNSELAWLTLIERHSKRLLLLKCGFYNGFIDSSVT